jgi:hypothetical protein
LQGKEPYENQTQDLCFVRAAVWKDHIRFGYLHFVTPGFSWPYMMDAPLFSPKYHRVFCLHPGSDFFWLCPVSIVCFRVGVGKRTPLLLIIELAATFSQLCCLDHH